MVLRRLTLSKCHTLSVGFSAKAEDGMAHLKDQFGEALSSIEPDDDIEHAPEAHEEVRDALEDDEVLTQAGISTVLIGSYKRRVSIKRIRDVDVFSKLEAGTDLGPVEILDHYETVLEKAFTRD